MNHKSISPNPQQPVDRVPAGQLPNALAELSEAALKEAAEVASFVSFGGVEYLVEFCSYEGDEE